MNLFVAFSPSISTLNSPKILFSFIFFIPVVQLIYDSLCQKTKQLASSILKINK